MKAPQLHIVTITLLLLFLSGCTTVYNNGFEEKRTSFFTQRAHVIYTYYYPDSVLDRKEHIYQKYDKTQKTYIELSSKTERFERETPYIRPIDTLQIKSPNDLKGHFFRKNLLPQSITFRDSSRFNLYGEGMSTCTTTPHYSVHGKYMYYNDILFLYTQQDQSLKIDTTEFRYTQDSLVQVTNHRLFDKKYYKRE